MSGGTAAELGTSSGAARLQLREREHLMDPVRGGGRVGGEKPWLGVDDVARLPLHEREIAGAEEK